MTEDTLAERVAAVERALLDGEGDLDGLADRATLADRIDDLEGRVEGIDERVAELEAASQALRGYVGGVRAVNADVERRADAALAKAESLERAVDPDRDPGLTVEEVDPADPGATDWNGDEPADRPTERRDRRRDREADDGVDGDDRLDLAGRLRSVL